MGESQGQKGLFAAAPYMSNEKRYPRGYTPGRMAEVRDSLMRMQPNGQKVPGSDHEYLSRQSAVKPPPLDDALMEGSKKSVAGRHERAVHEAIARSTMRHQTLRSVGSIEVNPERLSQYHAAGLYESRKHRITIQEMTSGDKRRRAPQAAFRKRFPDQVGAQKRGQSARDEADRSRAVTLIHELGHAQSYNDGERSMQRGQYPSVTTTMGSKVIGPEEAYADDHAALHHRQDPRERARNGPQEAHTYLSTGNLTHKDRYYVENRKHLQPGEADLALGDDELRAKNAARTDGYTKAAKAKGVQPELPGITRLAATANPHLDPWRPSERPAGLQSNHLNGRQFGGTSKP